MTDASFEARLARISARHETPEQTPEPPRKAGDREEKLSIALEHLEEGGVRGFYAYGPALQGLAKTGLIIKPLHYWSWVGLFIFFMLVLVAVAAFAIVTGLMLGHVPRPVIAIIEFGPVVFFTGTFVMSFVFTVIYKVKAMQIGLPRWRDL